MSAGHYFAVQYSRGGLSPCVRRRVHDYIATHFDRKITNDALAQIAGFSNQSHCIQSFQKIFGGTPGDYRRYRLQDSVSIQSAHSRPAGRPNSF